MLGPILFLIYVNDLTQYISDCLVVQYADDSQLIHTGTIDNIDDLMYRSDDFIIVKTIFINVNGLLMNTKKTQCMFAGSRGYISKIPPSTCLRLMEVR